MSQKQNGSEKIEEYENLQEEYKNLLSEYDDIKENDPSSTQLTNKVAELIEKQKEIQTTLSELKESSLNSTNC